MAALQERNIQLENQDQENRNPLCPTLTVFPERRAWCRTERKFLENISWILNVCSPSAPLELDHSENQWPELQEKPKVPASLRT